MPKTIIWQKVSKVTKITFDSDNRNIWHSGDTVQNEMFMQSGGSTELDQSVFIVSLLFPQFFIRKIFKPTEKLK